MTQPVSPVEKPKSLIELIEAYGEACADIVAAGEYAGAIEVRAAEAERDRLHAEIKARLTGLAQIWLDDVPRFPKGTPEYEEYARELRVELDKFAHGES
jgi:hypothetical protein